LTNDPDADVTRVARIDAVPTILEVVCRTTGMGFAAVARVTADRWIALAVRDEIAFGLEPGGELKVETTICDEIRDSGQAVVIDHVAESPQYCRHPTPAMYGFQSYISMPIVLPDGRFFGTLCSLDPRPARLNRPEIVGMFKLFADLIAFHLDTQERMAASEATLLDARESAMLREQFIAVLGHDLRNPLASIEAGARTLLRTPLNDKAKTVVGLMHSSIGRMAELIDNMLDFARGRLGGGILLERRTDPVKPALEQVIAELRAAWPERMIETDFALTDSEACNCDRMRIGQLLSNLVANALVHGSADTPVRVQAMTSGGIFQLSVANQGQPIPANMVAKLFQPFFRDAARRGQQGLGLGLYIASEIARAHGGTLDVASSPQETRFTFRMPVSQ
jgi:signal transduction histidine kinase